MEDGTNDCLSSLSNKIELYYVNLRDNLDLKWVKYFENNKKIRYLYLKGCNPLMNVNDISEIIILCDGHYDLPCKFLNGTTYYWGDYFTKSNPTTEKPLLTADLLKSDLTNNKTITHLNLYNCFTGNVSTEITNEVLNEILKTMPQLKYVRLDSTNLATLDFCEIIPNKDYAYCPDLIELDLRDTYVTDVSNLNNIIKISSKYSEGRNMGTLRFTASKNIVNGKKQLINLDSIQNVINGLTGGCYTNWINGCNSLVIYDYDTLKLLEKCTSLTNLRIQQWGFGSYISGSMIDLTGITALKSVRIEGVAIQFKLPSTVTYGYFDMCVPPVFGAGSSISSCMLTTDYVKSYITAENWRDFFKSCEGCNKIQTLQIYRATTFQPDYFKNESGDIIFTGKSVGKLIFQGAIDVSPRDEFTTFTNLTGLSVLTGLTNLSFKNLHHIQDWTEISRLTWLDTLSIDCCHFTDTNLLSSLRSLSTLTLTNGQNELLDIQGLSQLTGLESLTVTNTSISSCVPLMNLKELTYLDLRNNAIGQFSTSGGKSYNNLNILKDLHVSSNLGGHLNTLYLQGNNPLTGIIEGHEITKLKWNNGNIW